MKALGAATRLQALSLVDVAAFAAGLALVMLATVIVADQPARRATRVDPTDALRADA